MAKPEILSAFAYLNMPPGNPDLTGEQALDVGIFAASQTRPHFARR
jgi:cytochrome c